MIELPTRILAKDTTIIISRASYPSIMPTTEVSVIPTPATTRDDQGDSPYQTLMESQTVECNTPPPVIYAVEVQ